MFSFQFCNSYCKRILLGAKSFVFRLSLRNQILEIGWFSFWCHLLIHTITACSFILDLKDLECFPVSVSFSFGSHSHSLTQIIRRHLVIIQQTAPILLVKIYLSCVVVVWIIWFFEFQIPTNVCYCRSSCSALKQISCLFWTNFFVVDVVNEKRGPFGLRSKIVTVLSHMGAKTLKGAIHPFSLSQ